MPNLILRKNDRELLYSSFLFAGCDRLAVSRVFDGEKADVRLFKKGDIIPQEENGKHFLGFILAGTAEVAKPSRTDRLIMRTLSAGDVFGAAGIFRPGHEEVSTLTASAACRILFIDEPKLERLMKADFTVARNYIAFLSGRIRFLNRKISSLSAGSVEDSLILRLLEEDVSPVPVRSFTNLAKELSAGRASLYRAIEKLEAEGLILRGAHCIDILNKSELEKKLK